MTLWMLKPRSSQILSRLVELLGFSIQSVMELLEAGQEDSMDLHGRGDVHGGGVGVVTALALVDVVVGVDWGLAAQLAPQQLDGPVGDDLVGVHIGLGAGASLPDDQGEVIIIQLS